MGYNDKLIQFKDYSVVTARDMSTEATMSSEDAEMKALQRSIEKSKIERAKLLTPLERFRGGADLYDEGMQWLTFAIRASFKNPEFTPEQVDAEIERRKRIVKRIDDAGLFKPCGTVSANDQDKFCGDKAGRR